jgi:hypothetical protein
MPAMTAAVINDGLTTLRIVVVGADIIVRPIASRLTAYRAGSLDARGFVPAALASAILTLDRERASRVEGR